MRRQLRTAVAAVTTTLLAGAVRASVPVQQIEAFDTNPNGFSVVDFNGLATVTLGVGDLGGFWNGQTFHAVPVDRVGTSSDHAYAVGQYFYGNGSVGHPFVTDIYSDTFSNFFTNTVKDQGGISATGPLPGTFAGGSKIINNSYIADGGLADDLDALRRLDFMIYREDVTYVTAAASDSPNSSDMTVYYLGWATYNALAVHGRDGFSPSGSPGKQHADLSGIGLTSFETAAVSGDATALYGTAQSVGQSHALHGAVIRSMLMSGADKTSYNRQTINNLDISNGAGQANFDRSLSILQGGEKSILSVSGGNITGTAGTTQQGWSYGVVGAGGQSAVVFHSDGSLTGLTASLNWNVNQASTATTIDTTNAGEIFPHVNLELRPVTSVSGHYVLGAAYSDTTLHSAATDDNVQYLYYTPGSALPAGDYAFLFTGDASLSTTVGFSYVLNGSFVTQWNSASGGSWITSTNWVNGIPNGKAAQANFLSSPGLTNAGTITLDGNKTVGKINFNNSKSYTIAPGTGGTLTIDDTGDSTSVNPAITVSAGAHNINVPVKLINGVTISTSSGTGVTFGSAISGAGTLTTTGSGSVTLADSGSIAVPIVVNSGTFNIAAATSGGVTSRTIPSISIGTTGVVKLQDATSHANRTLLISNAAPSFAGSSNAWHGQLDIGSNDLILHNASLATVFNQIASGAAIGGTYFAGQGIMSSTAANDLTHRTAIGAVQTSLITTFDGQSVTATDVLLKYTWFGDADLNGKVDGNDYTLIDSGFGRVGATGRWNGDFNYDGRIDGSDYSLIDNAFNVQSGTPLAEPAAMVATTASQVSSSVPEPSTVLLLGIAALGAFKRSRRGSRS